MSAVRYLSSLRTWCARVIAATSLVQFRCSIAEDVRMRHIAMQSVNEAIGRDTKSTAAKCVFSGKSQKVLSILQLVRVNCPKFEILYGKELT